jgi:hypothetical protein
MVLNIQCNTYTYPMNQLAILMTNNAQLGGYILSVG